MKNLRFPLRNAISGNHRNHCSGVSTEQGPARHDDFGAADLHPARRFSDRPLRAKGAAGQPCRAAWMRTTSRTPSSIPSTSRGSKSAGDANSLPALSAKPPVLSDADVEPHRHPDGRSRYWICSSFAPSCITTTIGSPLPPLTPAPIVPKHVTRPTCLPSGF